MKASGTSLNGIDERGFVEVKFAPVLEMLDTNLPDTAVKDALNAALGEGQRHPFKWD